MNEAKDSLQSRALLSILDLIGEGEIEGLVNGERSIFFNETPLRNADGTYNFNGVTTAGTYGTNTQSPLTGFGSSIETPYNIGVKLNALTPYTFSVTNSAADLARVIVNIPALSKTNPENGDIDGTSVQYKFQLALNGGAFQDVEVDVAYVDNVTWAQVGGYWQVTAAGSSSKLIASITATSTGNGVGQIVVQPQEFNGTTWVNLGETKTVDVIGAWESTYSEAPSFKTRASLSMPVESVYNTIRFVPVSTRLDSGTSIQLAQGNASYWRRSATVTVSGKTRSKYQRSHILRLPTPRTSAQIRVTRLTADAADSLTVNETWIESFTEITSLNINYPNSALVGVRIDAQQFNSIPSRAYLVDGLKIQVPSNYNPVTRTYTGVWNGTFQTAYSNNPAWVLYDILTNNRYGLGNYIASTQVDKAALYTIGKYCDEIVPDGFGGSEPRFTINTVIQNAADAYKVITDITSAFRGMAFWDGGVVGFTQDAPADPSMLYTNANVVDGMFTYTGSSRRDRHSVVHVTWNDPSDNYKRKIEYVEDPELIQRFGIRRVDTLAFGCTSRGQAARVGRWILYTERYESDVIQFKVGLDAAFLSPGEIIKIHDRDKSGKRFGGRLVSFTSTTATLDSPVTLTTGTATISIMLPDGTFAERTLNQTPGTHTNVSWTTPLAQLPTSDAVWMLSQATLEPTLARVIGISQGENNTFEIAAIEHNPSKFGAIEQGLVLQTRTTSIIDAKFVDTPESLRVVERSVLNVLGQPESKLSISWYSNATTHEVAYRNISEDRGGNWTTVTVTNETFFELTDPAKGEYEIAITAVNPLGRRSKTARINFVVAGKTVNNDLPTDLTIRPLFSGLALTWTNADNKDFAGIEIWRSTSNVLLSAVRIDAVTTSTYSDMSVDNEDGEIFYWIRAFDTYGNYTAYVGPVSGTALEMPDITVDLTPPPTPTGLTATAALATIILEWAAPAYTNHDVTEIWASVSNAVAAATLIATTDTTMFAHALGSTGVTRYYWIRFRSKANVVGPYNAVPGVSATTGKIGNTDLGPLIVQAGNLANDAVTAAKLAGGAVDLTKFASGIEPVTIVTGSTVPTTKSTNTIFLTGTGKLYRWNGTAYIASVATTDLSGTVSDAQIAGLAASKVTGQLTNAQIADLAAAKVTGQLVSTQIADAAISTAKFASGIRPVEIVSALPSTGNFAGRMAFLTTDNKLYRHNGTAWVASVASTDISGTIADAQIAGLAASKVTGQLTNAQIADVAAAKLTGTITESQIASGAVSGTKFASGIEPVTVVSAVPGTKSTNTIFNTTDGKMYRWNGSAYVASVATTDLSGTISDAQIAGLAASKVTGQLTDSQIAAVGAAKVTGTLVSSQIADAAITTAKFAAGIEPIEIVGTLPTTGNFAGRVAFLTTDNKLYRHTGSAWVSSIASSDISGTIAAAQITSLAASQITGQLTDSQLAAIGAAKVTGQLTASQLNVSVGGGNLLPNASFEIDSNADGLSDNWAFYVGGTTPSISTSSVYGASAQRFLADGVAAVPRLTLVSNRPKLISGQAYVLTAWINITGTAYLSFKTFSAASGGGETNQGTGTTTVVGAGTYQRLTLKFVAPNSDFLAPMIGAIGTPAAGTAILIDGVQLELGDIATAFAPKPDEILPGTITATEISDNAITTPKLVAGAVAAGKIAAGAVSATEIAAGAITTAKLAAGAVTANEIAANTITAAKIAAGAITATEIASGAITTAKLAAGAVTANEIAASTITGGKIAAGTITGSNIAADTITAGQIAAGAVTASEVASNAITTSKLFVSGAGPVINDDPNTQDASAWAGGTIAIVSDTTSPTTSALQITSTGSTTLSARSFPLDAAKNYNLRVKAKQVSGTTPAYLLVAFFDSTGAVLSGTANPTGWPGAGSYHYFGRVNQTIPTSWTEYSISFGPDEVAKIPVNAVRAQLGFLGNYTGTGEQRFTSVRLMEKAAADLIVDGAVVASKVAAGAITTVKLDASAVTADKIAANAVTAAKIEAGAITTAKLAAGAVTANEIAADTITAGQIAAGAISASELAADAVTAGKIAANAVTAVAIEAGSITTAKIATGAVTADTIAANAITAAKIEAGAVTAAKIQAGAIDATKIAAATITGDRIAANTITGSNIVTDSITAAQIAAGAISASEIASSAITTDKLFVTGRGSALNDDPGCQDITTWQNGAHGSTATQVTVSDGVFGTSAFRSATGSGSSIETVKLYPVSSGKRYRISAWFRRSATGNGLIYLRPVDQAGNQITLTGLEGQTPIASWQKYSAEFVPTTTQTSVRIRAILNWTGTAGYHEVTDIRLEEKAEADLIVDGAITADKIAVNAVTAGKIATDAVTANTIAANAVTAAKIEAGAVTAAKIQAGSIDATKIAAGTITANEIAANTITGAKIAADTITAGNIATGAITAAEIAAGAIRAQHILVAPKSLNLDPSFEGGTSVWTGFVQRLARANAAVPASCPVPFAAQFSSRDNPSGASIEVVPGETYRASCYVNRGTGSGGSGIGIFGAVRAADGSSVASFAWPGTTTTATGWVRVTGLYTIPANGATMVFGPWADRPTYTGEAWYADLNIEKVADASLIVDGAITAGKIAANAIAVGTAAIQNGAIVNAMIGNAAIDDAKIANATITSAKIASLSVDKLTAGNLAVNQFIRSNSFVAGSSGWAINADGTAEFGAASIRGQLVASQINSNGLTIRDNAGNILFGVGNPLDFSNVGGTTKPAANATRNTISQGTLAARPTGSDGDFYYATDNFTLYQKISGAWVESSNRTAVDANGQMQGVSSGAGTTVANSQIGVNASGQITGIGTGANTTVANSQIAVNGSGQITGIGTGANTTVANSQITVTNGAIQGIGTGSGTAVANDQVRAGGVNLVGNSGFLRNNGTLPTNWGLYNNGGISVTTSVQTGGMFGQNYYRVTANASTTSTLGISINGAGNADSVKSWEPGQTYCISFWARGSAGAVGKTMTGFYSNMGFTGGVTLENPALTSSWQRYVYRGVPVNNASTPNGELYISWEQSGTLASGSVIDICCPKVELGTQPSAWTPSPQDTLNNNISISSGAIQGIGTGAGTAVANSSISVDGSGTIQGIGTGAGTTVANTQIAISGGAITGIGTGNNTAVANSSIGVNASGQITGIGTGVNTTVANNQITIASGAIQGIGTGAGTAVANSSISVDTAGAIQGIGTGAGQSVANNVDSVIRAPSGGVYVTSTATVSGALKIRLPQYFTDTMLRFTVEVYEYSTGLMCTIEIGGYNYGFNTSWLNVSARVIGGSNVEYPVYFGHDGTRCCVWIGASNESWSYPQVRVRDFFAGYNNFARSQWESGWQISFDTTSITSGSGTNQFSASVTDTFPGADWSKTARRPANLSSLAGTETIQNSQISISGGNISGIGTGNGTAVANSSITISSGAIQGIGTGAGTAVANSSISVSGGAIQGIGTGNGTAVANSSITLSATGALQNAGGGQMTTLTASDTRSTNEAPSWYNVGLTEEFKFRSSLGAPGSATYGILRTEKPWTDASGGVVTQTFKSEEGEWKRTSTPGVYTTWTSWTPKTDRQLSSSNIGTFVANDAIGISQIGTTLQTTNYSSTAGWQINKSGTATFNEVALRGAINSGSYTGYAWPASGTGFHLGPSGLLLGNYNLVLGNGQRRYFQIESNGNMYAPGFSIVDGTATFSGTVSANVINTDAIVGGAASSGVATTTTAASASIVVVVPANASAVLIEYYLGPPTVTYTGGGGKGDPGGYTYGPILTGLTANGATTAGIIVGPAAGTYTVTCTRSYFTGTMRLGAVVLKR